MRRRKHHGGTSVLLVCFALSAGVNGLIGVPLLDLVESYLSSVHDRPPVRLVRLSPEQWSANQQAMNAAARNPLLTTKPDPSKPPPPSPIGDKKLEPPKPKPEEKLSGQIVEVPPSADDSPNPDAKYLSKYNTHVDKESIARMEERDSRLKRITNKLQSKDVSPEQRRAQEIKTHGLSLKGDGLEENKDGKTTEKRFVLKVPDILRRDAVHLPAEPGLGPEASNRSASEALKGNSDSLDIQIGSGAQDAPGEAGGKKGPKEGAENKRELPTLSALVPNLGTLARISGTPSRDAVEGVPEGDGTFLNAKEFKYATFFYRVRDSVADHWEDLAASEYRRRDPTGNIYGIRDRATMLRIQLSKAGALDDIRVEQTSGVDFLDMVAIEAFKRAQPFPNPPPGIMDADGEIRFNFQFIITMNPGRNMNPFRTLH